MYIVIVVLSVTVITGTIACSRVGSDNQAFSESNNFKEREGLYLNLGAPSRCHGMLTAWHLRYEVDDCESDSTRTKTRRTRRMRETYTGVFIVYRPINQTMSYEAVPGSMKSVTVSCNEDNDERTHSLTRKETIISLQTNEQFMIQRGDVIAVCLPDTSSRHRNIFQILEDEEEIERNDIIYEYKDVKDCNSKKLQTIRSQQLKVKSSYRLHLYAEIAGRFLWEILLISKT